MKINRYNLIASLPMYLIILIFVITSVWIVGWWVIPFAVIMWGIIWLVQEWENYFNSKI